MARECARANRIADRLKIAARKWNLIGRRDLDSHKRDRLLPTSSGGGGEVFLRGKPGKSALVQAIANIDNQIQKQPHLYLMELKETSPQRMIRNSLAGSSSGGGWNSCALATECLHQYESETLLFWTNFPGWLSKYTVGKKNLKFPGVLSFFFFLIRGAARVYKGMEYVSMVSDSTWSYTEECPTRKCFCSLRREGNGAFREQELWPGRSFTISQCISACQSAFTTTVKTVIFLNFHNCYDFSFFFNARNECIRVHF